MPTIIEELYFLKRPVKKLIIFFTDIFLLIFSSYITHAIQLEYLPPVGRSLILYCFASSLIYFFFVLLIQTI